MAKSTNEAAKMTMKEAAGKVTITHGFAWASQPVMFVTPATLGQVMSHPLLKPDFDSLEIIRVVVLPTIKQVRVQAAQFRYWLLAFEDAEFKEDWVFSKAEIVSALKTKYEADNLKAVCVPPA